MLNDYRSSDGESLVTLTDEAIVDLHGVVEAVEKVEARQLRSNASMIAGLADERFKGSRTQPDLKDIAKMLYRVADWREKHEA